MHCAGFARCWWRCFIFPFTTHLELVGWHNEQKLMLLGTPDQALLPALILTLVPVIPVAALTYRWIEKPAMDLARGGLPAMTEIAWARSRFIRAALQRRHLVRLNATAVTARRRAPSGDLDCVQG
jgi:peptidoglycan/LPS O-acetylase OafA/YrhL